jgi:hypothetical protein
VRLVGAWPYVSVLFDVRVLQSVKSRYTFSPSREILNGSGFYYEQYGTRGLHHAQRGPALNLIEFLDQKDARDG